MILTLQKPSLWVFSVLGVNRARLGGLQAVNFLFLSRSPQTCLQPPDHPSPPACLWTCDTDQTLHLGLHSYSCFTTDKHKESQQTQKNHRKPRKVNVSDLCSNPDFYIWMHYEELFHFHFKALIRYWSSPVTIKCLQYYWNRRRQKNFLCSWILL